MPLLFFLDSFYYICVVDTKLLFVEWILYLHDEPVEDAIFYRFCFS